MWRNLPWWRQVRFLAKTTAIWTCLIWERIGIARDMDHGVQDNNFTVNGAKEVGVDLSLTELLAICIEENDRRLGGVAPDLGDVAHRGLELVPVAAVREADEAVEAGARHRLAQPRPAPVALGHVEDGDQGLLGFPDGHRGCSLPYSSETPGRRRPTGVVASTFGQK